MATTLRGVIVGAGHFADIQLEAWQSVKGARIVAILNRSLDNGKKLGDKYGISAYDDWTKIISEVQPDFIDICTPPDSHFHYAKLSADEGLPVLCQKPLSPTQEEGKLLVSYCQDRDVPLMINENWRWQAWYREIKQIMDDGLLGHVYTTYFAMRPGDGWGSEPYPVQPYFKEMKKFLIYETGVHWIDTFRYLFGEIRSVYCQLRTINPIIKGEDLAVIHFNFTSGAIGLYDANRTSYMERVRTPAYGIMTVEGTEGKLRLDEDGRIYLTLRGGAESEHVYPIPDGWKGGCAIATQQHFIDGLMNGGVFESSGTQYLKTVEAVYACYESARKNQVVAVSPLPEILT